MSAASESGPGDAPSSSRHDCADTDLSGLSRADEAFGFGSGRKEMSSHGGGRLPAGANLGGVTIVRMVAEGGMGRVYEGRQAAPDRTVAVKVLRGGLSSSSLVRRFEYEARVLARLKHPNVAQIFTFGTYDDSDGVVPFFVMEMIEAARPITRYAEDQRLGVRDRVAIMRRVCEAIAHGHQKGVIHRDLKPGNVLVDGGGEPKVIDFGVARSTDPDQADATQMTMAGDVIGTLRYMSPEQLGVGDGDVDARSDVYALGLLLHEVLTGSLPYELRGASFVEAARVLGDAAAVPTAAVGHAARRAGITASDARRLETIVATCLEKTPARRYATAVEVEAELGRWLAGDAILARPPTLGETIGRFARRHRAATAAGLASVVALVAATAGISFFYLRAERARGVADQARLTAELREADAESQAAAARAQLYVSNVLLAAAARDRDNVAEAGRLLDDARRLVTDAGTTNPVELACLDASLDDSVVCLKGHGGSVTAVGWSPDGTAIASGDARGGVRLGRVSSGHLRWSPDPLGQHEGQVWATVFSPDGRLLATTSADGEVRVWAVASGQAVTTLGGHDGAIYAAAFSPDGSRLATGGRDRTVRLWETSTWHELAAFEGFDGTVFGAVFSPDGGRLAVATGKGGVVVVDARDGGGRTTFSGHAGRVFAVAYAPTGSSLASVGEDATVRIWDLETGMARMTLRHPFRVNGVAWIGDGGRLATASNDSVMRIWDAADGRERARLRGHTATIGAIAGPRASGWLATGGGDGTLRVWDADFTVAPVMRADDKVLSVAWSQDGDLIATAMANSVVRLWDARTLTSRGVLTKGVGRVNDVRFSPDGGTIAGCCDDGSVQLWERSTRERREWIKPHDRRIYSLDYAPDGELLATAAEDGTARLWDLKASEPRGGPMRHGRRVFRAAFSPDGATLATACEDRTARLWRVADGMEIRRFEQHEAPVNWVAFSADGSMLATACSDGAVRVWSVADGGLVSVLTGPSQQVWKATFAPDGRRVAAVAADGTTQVWDVASGRAMPMLRGHSDQVWGVAFSPDGESLVTGAWDGTARVWGVSTSDIARRRNVMTRE
jgi:WD40 repeat protein